jgi:hypothetical protein
MLTVLLLLTSVLAAEREPGWSKDHGFALGVRASGWFGDYAAGGLGGQLQIRPWRRFGCSCSPTTCSRSDATWSSTTT